MNLTITKSLVFILTAAFSTSCKHNKKVPDKAKTNNHREYYLDVYFPDTVTINNTYEGNIVYKGILDTITTKLFVEGNSMRLLTLYLKNNKTLIKSSYNHILKSKEKDTFYPSKNENNYDIFFEYKFKNLGINYLEGILEDEVYLNTNDTSKLRIITKYNHITLPVFVTDNENIIDSYFKDDKVMVPTRL